MADERPKEIVMPVALPDALTHIEITVLRQISENINTQTRHLENLTAKVDDVRERVIRIEAAELKKAIEKLEEKVQELESEKVDAAAAVILEARIKLLESQRDKVEGATSLVGWLSRNAPWIVTLLAIIAAYLGLKGHP